MEGNLTYSFQKDNNLYVLAGGGELEPVIKIYEIENCKD